MSEMKGELCNYVFRTHERLTAKWSERAPRLPVGQWHNHTGLCNVMPWEPGNFQTGPKERFVNAGLELEAWRRVQKKQSSLF